MKAVNVLVCAAFLVVTIIGSSAIAAEKTVKILAPWQAQGQIFKIAPDKFKIVGAFNGIMYIDDGAGDLNAALFMCPGQQYIDLKTKQTSLEADCIISKGDNKIAYAKMKTSGQIGASQGTFRIVGGEGKWKGISGEGKVVVRTALGNIGQNKKNGAVINDSAGLAVWPALKVKMPR